MSTKKNRYRSIAITFLLIMALSVIAGHGVFGKTLENFTTGVASGLPSSGDYNYIAVGDVDGDGNEDMAFGGENYGSASSTGLYVYRGDGSGKWTSASSGLPTYDSWGGIQFADADGDDKVEIYGANEGWGTHNGPVKGVGAWEYSSGSWSPSGITQPYNGSSAYANDIVVKNFTKGAGLDIAIATSNQDSSGIIVYYGSGSSPVSWTSHSTGLPSSGEYTGIDVGDLNNDGYPDIATVPYTSTGLRVYTQDSDGTGWTGRNSNLPTSLRRTSLGVVIGDVNNDGDGDIVVGTRDNGLRLILGNGGGASGTSFSWTDVTSSIPSSYRSSGRFAQIQLADMDQDGDLDLLAPEVGSGLILLLGNGTDKPGTNIGWTEVKDKNLPTSMDFYGSNFFDFDSDGDLDIAGATWGNGIKVYETNLKSVVIPGDPPVPDAGEDQSCHIGKTVYLNGTGSSDTEDAPSGDSQGDILTYVWNLTSKPDGSAITAGSLTPSDSDARPHFKPDREGLYTFSLAVQDTDGKWSNLGDEDSVSITVVNFKPVPDGGNDVTIYLGETVRLNGTGSTDFEDAPYGDLTGKNLSYDWNVTLYPPGSTVRDSSLKPTDNDSKPSFVPDMVGTYYLTLAVNDSYSKWSNESDEDMVTVSVLKVNDPPVADAGVDRSVYVGDEVILDGSRSRDKDGAVVGYNWTCTTHTLTPEDPETAMPSFTPDEAGVYTFTLKVMDDNDTWSRNEDSVTINVIEPGQNLPPTADAGVDIDGLTGEMVILDGTGSDDPDGEIVTWEWTCTSHAGISLTDSNSSSPSFTPQEEGEYAFQLRVKDDNGTWSSPDTVAVLVEEPYVNEPPTAKAGEDQEVEVGDQVTLDGSESLDDGTIEGYQWVCTSHTISISGSDTARAKFTPEEPGTYVFELTVVDDEGVRSDPDEVIVTVNEKPPEDPPLFNVTIGPFLYDDGTPVVDGNVTLDKDSGMLQIEIEFTSVTDENGFALFNEIPEGNYDCTLELGEEEVIAPFEIVVDSTGSYTITGGDIPRVVKEDDVDDEPPDDEPPDEEPSEEDDGGSALFTVIILLILLILVGVAVAVFFLMHKKKDEIDEDDESRKCPQCGADMEHDEDFDRYKCPECGKYE